MNLTWNEMLDLRKEHAKNTNTSRFVINAISVANKTTPRNKDKDGLSREKRAEIEAVKDKITYPDDEDLW